MTTVLDTVLDEVFLALRGSPTSWRVVPRKDGNAHVAALACLKRPLILPLREGENLVGRSAHSDYGAQGAKPYLFETMQWRIRCESGVILVTDAWTTNLSDVVPAEVPAEEDDRRALFDGGKISARRISIPHANLKAPPIQVHHGDVLCGGYASFLLVVPTSP